MLPGRGTYLAGIPGASNEVTAMTQSSQTTLGIRINSHNPDHHLWNNKDTWFVHYTIYPTPVTAERVRRSLKTRDRETARQKRDVLFSRLNG